ncbi:MAG TPA: hypothetical protein VH598_13000 [Verrucomicrobiae bacterium]|nr:hypothetical protein [Verrucomicrobiae bacterium]
MKMCFCLTTMLLAAAFALSAQTPPPEQMKGDLIGQTMGGRERCWKFQSVDQIKELTIKDKTENARQRIYTVALQLQATNAPTRFAAEARVEYDKTGAGWKIQRVGLLSLKKIK